MTTEQVQILHEQYSSSDSYITKNTVIGIKTEYNSDGSIKRVERESIQNIDTGTRVKFRDNSYLVDCKMNEGSECWPSLQNIRGTVCRTNSSYIATWDLCNMVIEMPIVVLLDNGNVLYCNPLNIEHE